MSIEYLNAAFQVRLMGSTKAVLVALADRANKAGYCVASMDDIALRAGCSVRSAIRAVSDLESRGLVVVVRDTGRANRYLLMVEKFSTSDDTVSPDFSEFSTASDNASPEKVIHTSDTVSKTRDISAKTSDTTSYKPYNQNNHNARAREVGVMHKALGLSESDQPQGRQPMLPVIGGLVPPPAQCRRPRAGAVRELTHIRALLLDNAELSRAHDELPSALQDSNPNYGVCK